ncbi:MAG: response regulator [Myxococcus sp.]|nr:response regulator [Myxococcus sp.]
MNPKSPYAVLLDVMSQASHGVARGQLLLDATGVVREADARATQALGGVAAGLRLDVLVPFLAANPEFERVLAQRRAGLLETRGPGLCGVALAPAEVGFVGAVLVAPVFDAAFQATPAMVVVVDADLHVVEANALALTLFGASHAEVQGRLITELIPSELLEQVVRASLARREAPAVVSFEWARPGGRRVFELRCSRLAGRLQLAVLKLLDVTGERQLAQERERLLEAVHQSQKLDAIGQLASGVAHDMNNVLAVVQTCAGALRDEVHEALHKADAEQILLATQRARDLLHQLLTFARKTPARTERFDVLELGREAASLVTRLLPPNVRLALRLPSAPCEVTGDRSQLLQTLINVSLNARDAMPHGGTITFAAVFDDRRVSFTISDTGEGMPPEVMQRAFEPFFTTKQRGSGTGLGLSMAYTCLRAHRGDIRLESEPGKGTRVSMWLPREWQALADTDTVTPITGERGVVMVVDDDEATRRVLGRFLKRLGYAVHLAESGEEAVALLRDGLRPTLVVCDLVMPGIDGNQTLTQLRALEPAVRVVITSGFLDERNETEIREAGGTGLLRKPFSLDDVALVVSQLKS